MHLFIRCITAVLGPVCESLEANCGAGACFEWLFTFQTTSTSARPIVTQIKGSVFAMQQLHQIKLWAFRSLLPKAPSTTSQGCKLNKPAPQVLYRPTARVAPPRMSYRKNGKQVQFNSIVFTGRQITTAVSSVHFILEGKDSRVTQTAS